MWSATSRGRPPDGGLALAVFHMVPRVPAAPNLFVHPPADLRNVLLPPSSRPARLLRLTVVRPVAPPSLGPVESFRKLKLAHHRNQRSNPAQPSKPMGDARSCSTFSALASPNLRASAAMPGHILTGAGHMSIVPKAGHGRLDRGRWHRPNGRPRFYASERRAGEVAGRATRKIGG